MLTTPVRMLAYASVFCVGTAAVGCAPVGMHGGLPQATAEEYGVYGAVVWEVFTGAFQGVAGARRDSIPTGTYVFTVRTLGLAEVMDTMLFRVEDLDSTAVQDYLAANRGEFELEPRIPGIEEQVVLSDREVEEVFGEEGWDGFYSRYPDAVGIVGLSRVGFSDDGRSALVFVSRYHGGLNGEFGILHLRRGSDGWSVVGWPVGKAISELLESRLGPQDGSFHCG